MLVHTESKKEGQLKVLELLETKEHRNAEPYSKIIWNRILLLVYISWIIQKSSRELLRRWVGSQINQVQKVLEREEKGHIGVSFNNQHIFILHHYESEDKH